jgi:Helix-turn-helix domain
MRDEFACRQLATSDIPLLQIALSAGFPDQSRFTKAFRNQARVTPGEFRHHCRAKLIPRDVSPGQDCWGAASLDWDWAAGLDGELGRTCAVTRGAHRPHEFGCPSLERIG